MRGAVAVKPAASAGSARTLDSMRPRSLESGTDDLAIFPIDSAPYNSGALGAKVTSPALGLALGLVLTRRGRPPCGGHRAGMPQPGSAQGPRGSGGVERLRSDHYAARMPTTEATTCPFDPRRDLTPTPPDALPRARSRKLLGRTTAATRGGGVRHVGFSNHAADPSSLCCLQPADIIVRGG